MKFTEITGEAILQALLDEVRKELADQSESPADLTRRLDTHSSQVYRMLARKTTPVLNEIAKVFREYGYTGIKIDLYLE